MRLILSKPSSTHARSALNASGKNTCEQHELDQDVLEPGIEKGENDQDRRVRQIGKVERPAETRPGRESGDTT